MRYAGGQLEYYTPHDLPRSLLRLLRWSDGYCGQGILAFKRGRG